MNQGQMSPKKIQSLVVDPPPSLKSREIFNIFSYDESTRKCVTKKKISEWLNRFLFAPVGWLPVKFPAASKLVLSNVNKITFGDTKNVCIKSLILVIVINQKKKKNTYPPKEMNNKTQDYIEQCFSV